MFSDSNSRFFDICAQVLLFVALVEWFTTVKAYGRLPFKAIWQMVKLIRGTMKIFLFTSGLIAIFAAFGNTLLDFSPFPFSFQFTLGLFAVTSVCLPPSVLLLGTSKAQNAGLYSQILWGVTPLRLVHMLDDLEFGAVHGDQLHQFNYRALPSASWETIVRRLMETVPVVVIDTRIRTRSIVQEAKMLLSSNCGTKTIFIVESMEHNLVTMLATQLGAYDPLLLVSIVTPDDVVPFVKRVRNQLLFG